MVKCGYCGFENTKVDICDRCGHGIQRYIKAFGLRTLDDVSTIKEDLESGNVLVVNVIPFIRGKEGSEQLESLGEAVFDLIRHALSVGGDAARMGEERVILAPFPFRISRPELQAPRPHRKHEEKLFRECPYCGVSVKVSNMDSHIARLHGEPTWAEEGIPSAGTIARFFARNSDQLSTWLAEAGKSGEIDEFMEAVSSHIVSDVFADRAVETGRFREVILAVDRLKDEAGGDEVGGWVLETQLGILCSWKPGFEDYLSELFFTEERCRNCKQKDKKEARCREGLSSCVFDGEFEQFEDESVRKIVEDLRNGVEPKELEVPKRLQERWIKLRNLYQAAAKKSEQKPN